MNIRTAPFLRSYVKLAFVVAFTICRFLWSGQLANAADNEKPALSYEDAISQCGLSRELADMKLAVYLYIPESEAMFANARTLEKACKRFNSEGEKCYMTKPVPIVEIKHVLGEICHKMKKGGGDFVIDNYKVQLSYSNSRDQTVHQIVIEFKKFNENTLLTKKITYDDGQPFEDQGAGFMLWWFFNPSAI